MGCSGWSHTCHVFQVDRIQTRHWQRVLFQQKPFRSAVYFQLRKTVLIMYSQPHILFSWQYSISYSMRWGPRHNDVCCLREYVSRPLHLLWHTVTERRREGENSNLFAIADGSDVKPNILGTGLERDTYRLVPFSYGLGTL